MRQTISGVAEVLRSGWITSGPQVREFEAQLSAYCGGRPVRVHELGHRRTGDRVLRSPASGPGDEVITHGRCPGSRTANVIVRAGARPVFVDVDPCTRNIDLARVEAAITPRTRALLPVDLAGLPVDRDRAVRDRAPAPAARDRGRRAVDGRELGRRAHRRRAAIWSRSASTPTRTSPPSRAAAWCSTTPRRRVAASCGACRACERFADGELDCDLAWRQAQSDRRRRAHRPRAARAPRGVQRTAARCWRAATSSASIARCGCELPLEDFEHSNWHMFQIVLPAQRASAATSSAPMHAAGIGVGVHYPAMHLLSLYRGHGLRARGLSHRRAHRPPASRRCRCFRRCASRTWIASACRRRPS